MAYAQYTYFSPILNAKCSSNMNNFCLGIVIKHRSNNTKEHNQIIQTAQKPIKTKENKIPCLLFNNAKTSSLHAVKFPAP